MTKLKYCKRDFLEDFSVNFDMYLDMYKTRDKEKIREVFNEDNVLNSNISFEYKELKTKKNSMNPERDNIKIIYDSLNFLTPSQATEERLWVAMYNTYYLDHLIDYIDNNIANKNFEQKLKGSVVFTSGHQRSLIVQNIARFWWLGYYLYDEENKYNPYELMEFYTSTGDIIGKSTVFFSSNLTSNKNLRLGIIEGIKELTEKEIIENKRKYYVETNKYFNLIGGIKLLDYMTREDSKEITKKYLLEYIEKED